MATTIVSSARSNPQRTLSPHAISDRDLDHEGLLASIVKHSHDAIFSRTLKGIITSWNQGAERIFGYSAQEILGKSSRRLLPKGQRDEFLALLATMRKGRVVEHFQTQRIHKSGRSLDVSLTLSPIWNMRRKLVGFSTIARDISRENRVVEALREREQELQDLLEQASVGIVSTSHTGLILQANPAFAAMLKSTPERLHQLGIGQFFCDLRMFHEMLRQLSERKPVQNWIIELKAASGEVRHAMIDANPFLENGVFAHSRWFVRDISRRRQLERELLELTERERRSFANELHDGLGQELGGVAYLANVLKEKLQGRNAPEAQDAHSIYELVRRAMEHARGISRGLCPIEPSPDGLMNALSAFAHHISQVYPVRCSFRCPSPVRILDSSVAGHLYRIAQEAVNNALKHGKPSKIQLTLRKARNGVSMQVADNGKGIGMPPLSRHGLGLRIMNYRADLIRGFVNVQGLDSGGTRVQCWVPDVPGSGKENKSEIHFL